MAKALSIRVQSIAYVAISKDIRSNSSAKSLCSVIFRKRYNNYQSCGLQSERVIGQYRSQWLIPALIPIMENICWNNQLCNSYNRIGYGFLQGLQQRTPIDSMEETAAFLATAYDFRQGCTLMLHRKYQYPPKNVPKPDNILSRMFLPLKIIPLTLKANFRRASVT